jgi:hypothetical protein
LERQNASHATHCLITRPFLFMAIFLICALTGCTSSPQNNVVSLSPTSVQQHTRPVAASPTSQQPYGPQLTPLPTLPPSALHGPTNFVLRTPFTFSDASGTTRDGSGTSTALTENTVKTEISKELEHLLFVVTSDNTVTIYSPDTGEPIKATVTQRSDGSTALDYTQSANSTSGSLAITFNSAIFKDQIIANYRQQYSPVITSGGSASDVTVSFTTHIQWVSTEQIPTAPKNGTYQLTDTSIALSWQAGKNASKYDIYRIIPGQDQQFQFLDTIKETTYRDINMEAVKQAQTKAGIAYAIFSVGPTGVENPGYMAIAVTVK